MPHAPRTTALTAAGRPLGEAREPAGAGRPRWLGRAPAWLLAARWPAGYLMLAPSSPDLAAASYRSDLFSRVGFSLWDNSWYGGHHLPAYSLLAPALGALLGPRLLVALAVVAQAVIFERLLARETPGTPGRVASLWFAFGAGFALLSSRVPYDLGLALGLAALLLARPRPRVALVLCCCARWRARWRGRSWRWRSWRGRSRARGGGWRCGWRWRRWSRSARSRAVPRRRHPAVRAVGLLGTPGGGGAAGADGRPRAAPAAHRRCCCTRWC